MTLVAGENNVSLTFALASVSDDDTFVLFSHRSFFEREGWAMVWALSTK